MEPAQFLNCANVISTLTVHVHGVVTDWSYALAKFLVSSLFRAFSGNPSNVTHFSSKRSSRREDSTGINIIIFLFTNVIK